MVQPPHGPSSPMEWALNSSGVSPGTEGAQGCVLHPLCPQAGACTVGWDERPWSKAGAVALFTL